MSTQTPSGILLVNLGTPGAPTAAAVRKYLAEFLRDKRVVEIPRLIWLPILYGLILPFLPKRVAKNYAGIWQEDGSPLLAISRRQATALQNKLGESYQVALAMRYGQPSISEALDKLISGGCEHITVLPLYPQYSATTTAAVWDAISQYFSSKRAMPGLSFIRDYHDHPAYINALAQSISTHWDTQGRNEKLLMSFHGIPQRNVDLGDPYASQCENTARLVADRLGLKADEWAMTYQSRFGKATWLQPYTDKTLEAWGKDGIKTVDVVCPGFAADCLETLEEIQVENAEVFSEAGGKQLSYIPALNESDLHIEMMSDIVR